MFPRIVVSLLVLFLASAPRPAGAGAEKAQGFIAREVLNAVVGIRIEVDPSAITAGSLGFDREGVGVVIDDQGLILTVGYLILEAEKIDIVLGTEDAEVVVPAKAVAYDHETGFGLVRATAPLGVQPVTLGDSDTMTTGTPGLAASRFGARPLTPVRVADRRTFAGYWEFIAESGLFTTPAHLHYGGAPLFDKTGALVGIGSIFVNDADPTATAPSPGNMFLPINTLKPVLTQLIANGKRDGKPRPWLGLSPTEIDNRVVVTRVRSRTPAYASGLRRGDIIMGVNGKHVRSMADLYRKVWASGDAGVTVVLDVLKPETADLGIEQIEVESIDRLRWLYPDGIR